MKLFNIIGIICIILSLTNCKPPEERLVNETFPNIIIIYLDDLGYGDVGAYGSTELKTPNIDKLANGGIRFADGYASSATCSPSRYALLTGTYPWRNERAKILSGTAPLLIVDRYCSNDHSKNAKVGRISYWNRRKMAFRTGRW
jgi:hypothetical protein